MPTDPYDSLLDESPYANAKKTPVVAELVVVLDVRYEEGRGLNLITPLSRALPRGEIHEVMLTDEADPRDGGTVDRASVVGFVEIDRGGVVAVGDEARIGDRSIGTVAGFDETHMPNHQNIVVESDDLRSGVEMELALETAVTFDQRPE